MTQPTWWCQTCGKAMRPASLYSARSRCTCDPALRRLVPVMPQRSVVGTTLLVLMVLFLVLVGGPLVACQELLGGAGQ